MIYGYYSFKNEHSQLNLENNLVDIVEKLNAFGEQGCDTMVTRGVSFIIMPSFTVF